MPVSGDRGSTISPALFRRHHSATTAPPQRLHSQTLSPRPSFPSSQVEYSESVERHGERTTERRTAHSSHQLLSLTTPNLLPAGVVSVSGTAELRYDFTFPVPPNLPPSFVGHDCAVEYTVVASSSGPNAFSTRTARMSLPLDVYDSVPPTLQLLTTHSIDHICCQALFPCCLKSKGLISVALVRPDRIHFGQPVKLRAVVRMPQFFGNGGDISKLRLELSLLFVRVRRAQGHNDWDRHVMSRTIIAGAEAWRGPEANLERPEEPVVDTQPGAAAGSSDGTDSHEPVVQDVEDPYAPVDDEGLQHCWDAELLVEETPQFTSFAVPNLQQTAHVVFVAHYGSRSMIRLSPPVHVAGKYESQAFSPPAGPPTVPIVPQMQMFDSSAAYPPQPGAMAGSYPQQQAGGPPPGFYPNAPGGPPQAGGPPPGFFPHAPGGPPQAAGRRALILGPLVLVRRRPGLAHRQRAGPPLRTRARRVQCRQRPLVRRLLRTPKPQPRRARAGKREQGLLVCRRLRARVSRDWPCAASPPLFRRCHSLYYIRINHALTAG